jgi:Nucleotidyltransferase of unknown function (DUF6036)
MPGLATDIWSLVFGRPQIDPDDLAAAVQELAGEQGLDYRARLLVRDSLNALKDHWGSKRFDLWLMSCPTRGQLESIWREAFERPGFTLIGRRLMEKTQPDAIKDLLRELGAHIRQPLRLNVGWSVALILPGYVSRHTEDIDVVDEVPREVREQYALLDGFKQRFGMLVAHFGSHYLPTGWQNRLHHFADFDKLRVYLVDVVDVFLGKLFSKRSKDLDDLRMLAPQLDKDLLGQRLKDTTAALQKDPNLLALAQKSWYLVFGEALPT